MVEQCGSSLFHGPAADSFRTSYCVRVCVCVWQAVQTPPAFFFLQTFPSATFCSFTVGEKYISLSSSCRGFRYYRLHTCPPKLSGRKGTVVMPERSIREPRLLFLGHITLFFFGYLTNARSFPAAWETEQQLIHHAPAARQHLLRGLFQQGAKLIERPFDWSWCSFMC